MLKKEEIKAFYELSNELVLSFHRLKKVAEDIHGDSESTAGRRGVMMSLFKNGSKTVPDLARERPVSRQHIQKFIDVLKEEGLVEIKENPIHKRSSLIALSKLGYEKVKEYLAKEEAILESIEFPLSAKEMEKTSLAIKKINEFLMNTNWKSKQNSKKRRIQ